RAGLESTIDLAVVASAGGSGAADLGRSAADCRLVEDASRVEPARPAILDSPALDRAFARVGLGVGLLVGSRAARVGSRTAFRNGRRCAERCASLSVCQPRSAGVLDVGRIIY